MPKRVKNLKVFRQNRRNSCWAAVTRCLLYSYTSAERLADDHAVVSHINTNVNPIPPFDIKVCQPIQTVLNHFGMSDGQDDENFPKFSEIMNEIDNDKPLIACVKTRAVTPGSNVRNGHYVAIVGYDNTPKKKLIQVMDPNEKKFIVCEYNKVEYNHPQITYYWGVTEYTKHPDNPPN